MTEVLEREETEVSRLELYSNGIIRHSYVDNAVVDEDEARRVIEICAAFTGPTRRLLLLNDMRGKVSFSRGARTFFREQSPPDTCMAFVINSKVGEMAVNFFLKFNTPDYNLRVFHDQDEAMEWLKAFLTEAA